jgi:O-methyltransferase
MKIRSIVKKYTPWTALYVYRKIYYLPKDAPVAIGFLFNQTKSPTSFLKRLKLVGMFYLISYKVDCPHTEHELLTIARKILNLGKEVEGAIVEAGSYYGGSTAKLSLVARLCERKLEVFDSFEGMPENNETHGKSIFKREHHFPKGSHAVSLETVKRNVLAYGDISRCQFHKGWFKDTLPELKQKVAVACINADLVQSTKDCLKYLSPLMGKGGIIFSQDGHFPWIIDVLKDDSYWQKELGIKKPQMEGLGTSKLVAISF